MTTDNDRPKNAAREFFRQLYFELVKMFSRKRTHIGFGVFIVLELAFALLFKREESVKWVHRMMEKRVKDLGIFGRLIDPDYYYSALTMGHMILGVAVVLLGGLFLALVAGDIVSKEEEDGTLRMVLSRPVTRARLLLIKYCACAVFTVVLVSFAAFSSLGTGFLFWRGDGGFFMTSKDLDLTAFHEFGPGLGRFCLAVPFLAVSMFTVTSFAFMFSCLRMKPATATILTLALLFIDIILKRMEPLEDIKHHFITSRMSSWQLVLGREIDWGSLATNFAILGVICAATFLAGRAAFSRRDFKS